jgi:hypothetical protein
MDPKMNQRDPFLSDLLHAMVETASDRINAAVAASAILTPLWRERVRLFSEDAALFMPILGVAWLCVQIIAKLIELRCRVKN